MKIITKILNCTFQKLISLSPSLEEKSLLRHCSIGYVHLHNLEEKIFLQKRFLLFKNCDKMDRICIRKQVLSYR